MRDQISNAEDIPTGFKLLPAGYGFTDVLFPLYRRVSDSGVEFGILSLVSISIACRYVMEAY